MDLSRFSIEQIEAINKIVSGGAGIGFSLLLDGVLSFDDWHSSMAEALGERLRKAGFNDEEIQSLIRDMWLAPFERDGETKSIEEWAKDIMLGQENNVSDMHNNNNRRCSIGSKSSDVMMLRQELDDCGYDVLHDMARRLIDTWKSMPSGLEHCCLASFWERICAQIYENHFSDYGPDLSLMDKEKEERSDVEREIFKAADEAIRALSPADLVVLKCWTHFSDFQSSLHALMDAIESEAYQECVSPSETLDRYVNGNDIGALLAEAEGSSEGAFEFLKRVVESEEFDDDTMVALLKLLNEGID